MTQEQAVQQWLNGAQVALKSAEVLYTAQQYEYTLFMCHLVIEKYLKAQ